MAPTPHDFRPRFNVCPTTTVDAIVAEDGKRELIRARWGLIPNWWSKPLKNLKLATFNARAETSDKPPRRAVGLLPKFTVALLRVRTKQGVTKPTQSDREQFWFWSA
jgi:hypothetical protein